MTTKIPLPPPGFDELTVEDQIAYVESLWDRIAASPDDVPVPEWHKQMVAQRLAMDSEPSRPWDEVSDELHAKLMEQRDR